MTSGAPSPTLKKPIGMAYIDSPHNKLETQLKVDVRGKLYPLTVKKMPFVPHRYYRKVW